MSLVGRSGAQAAVVLMTVVAGFASGIEMSNPRALAH
jgi:hypothetical protein